MSVRDWLVLYVDGFGMVPVFVRDVEDQMVPVHRYRDDWITRPRSLDEVLSLYDRVRDRIDGVALATGPYNSLHDLGRGVIDVDDILGRDRDSIVKRISYRYPVVVTRRGFHIHFLINSDSKPYMLRVTADLDDERKHIGEGGVLFPHLWTSPPSIRGGFVYKWVINGKELNNPIDVERELRKTNRDELLPVTDIDELSNDLTGVLDETIVVEEITGTGGNGTGITVLGGEGSARTGWKPFRKIDDLLNIHKTIPPRHIPPCLLEFVTKTLYHYLDAKSTAVNIWMIRRDIDYPGNKVPHGRRFLTLLTYTYLVLNLVEEPDIGYLNDIFYSITEDYPGDRGEPLDKKISRLVSGSVVNPVPRYTTLGSMGEMYCSKTYIDKCPYRPLCLGGKKPWLPVRMVLGRIEEAKKRSRRYPGRSRK